MPIFNFNCAACGRSPTRRIARTADEALAKASTCSCGGEMVRVPKPPTSTVFERLDNGMMVRAVERPADAERLYKERALQDPLAEK